MQGLAMLSFCCQRCIL